MNDKRRPIDFRVTGLLINMQGCLQTGMSFQINPPVAQFSRLILNPLYQAVSKTSSFGLLHQIQFLQLAAIRITVEFRQSDSPKQFSLLCQDKIGAPGPGVKIAQMIQPFVIIRGSRNIQMMFL